MTRKIELFHFGDCGIFDELNPFYIFGKENAPEVLFAIADSEPFKLQAEDISDLLNCELKDIKNILDIMVKIHMISMKNNKYSINFPVFLEKDLYLLDKFSKEVSEKIGRTIITNEHYLNELVSRVKSYNNFTDKRLLYHIIGDYIFDGTALDYFGSKGIFKISKNQPEDRDYILIGFEESEKVFNFSENILCSSNNYIVRSVRFNSFGDGNGNRKDLYRFFRQVNTRLKSVTDSDKLNLSYIKLIEQQNLVLAKKCAEFIERLLIEDIYVNELTQIEKDIFSFLNELGYINEDENLRIVFNVPVFYKEDISILNEISKYILSLIEDEIKHAFKELNNEFNELSAIKHDVDVKEIANELWHQVFGNINEYLVEKNFFEKPSYIDGQGRFLQSIYIIE